MVNAKIWKMRRLTADEHPQLWHLQVSESNGYYTTACGLRFGIAGSASRSYVPAGACAKCAKALSKAERDHQAAQGNGELKGRESSDGPIPDSGAPRRLTRKKTVSDVREIRGLLAAAASGWKEE